MFGACVSLSDCDAAAENRAEVVILFLSLFQLLLVVKGGDVGQ